MTKIEECGCYDGTWSPDDQTDVTIRCPAHVEDPGYRDGAHRMTTIEAAIASVPAMKRALRKGLLKPPPQRVDPVG